MDGPFRRGSLSAPLQRASSLGLLVWRHPSLLLLLLLQRHNRRSQPRYKHSPVPPPIPSPSSKCQPPHVRRRTCRSLNGPGIRRGRSSHADTYPERDTYTSSTKQKRAPPPASPLHHATGRDGGRLSSFVFRLSSFVFRLSSFPSTLSSPNHSLARSIETARGSAILRHPPASYSLLRKEGGRRRRGWKRTAASFTSEFHLVRLVEDDGSTVGTVSCHGVRYW